MPPSARKKKATAKAEPEQRVNAETAEAVTPSKKRRRVCYHPRSADLMTWENADPSQAPKDKDPISNAKRARRASAESDATIEHQDGDTMSEEPEYAEAEALIQRLQTAKYQVNVAIECNNAIVPPNQQAFAKIAGRNWTYYVKQTNVVIGRPNTKPKEMMGDEGGVASAVTGTVGDASGTMEIGIDLGPDHQVSRVHAEIQYQSESGEWLIHVNGRNGLHLDDMRLERGQLCTLHSGAVLSILGTQMIFILPNEAPFFHPDVRRELLQEPGDEDEQYQPGDGVPRGTNVRYAGLPPPTYQSGAYLPPASGSGGTQAAQALAALSSATAPGTPRLQPPQPKSKNSPAYAVKGLMLDSADEIDYAVDSAKDIKPPHSYAQMIGQAIMSRSEENATLSQIYDFIKEHYAFFRINGGGWQNSIRHNLSLSKHFEKIPRRTDEPGKGMKWQIVPSHRDEYMKKNFHDVLRRPVHRPQYEGPELSSDPVAQTQRLVSAINGESSRGVKRRTGSPTPPRNGYPVPTESYTPDRGPRLQTGHFGTANGVPLSGASEAMTTPTFDRTNPLASQQTFSAGSHQSLAADSPPTLVTGLQHDTVNGMMHTPLPARSALKPFPSTIKPPSFYAKELFSSPAPFWKFANVANSTPYRMPDLSPDKIMRPPIPDDDLKTDEVEEEDDEEEAPRQLDKGKGKSTTPEELEPLEETEEGVTEAESNVVPPSSPPRTTKYADDETEAPDESPTRTVSRPVSRREPVTNVFPNGTTPTLQASTLAPPPPQPRFSMSTGLGIGGGSMQKFGYYGQRDGDDGSDDEGIDLSK